MTAVWSCIQNDHSLFLLLVSAAICGMSGLLGLLLFSRARQDTKHSNHWGFLSGLTVGTGIWATHFIAALAYDYRAEFSFDLAETALSFILIALSTALAWNYLLRKPDISTVVASGLILGLGAGVMHYLGMFGIRFSGHIHYDPVYTIASFVFGCVFTIGYILLLVRPAHALVPGMTTFILAICGLHLIGMAGITLDYDPSVPADGLVEGWLLAVAIGAIMTAIFSFGFAALFANDWVASVKEEARHIHQLADATMEGMVIAKNGRILEANAVFCNLVGWSRDAIIGVDMSVYLPEEKSLRQSEVHSCTLRTKAGGSIPVEAYMRSVEFLDGCKTVYSVRDLQVRRANEARIEYLAHHDPLTGLRNRARLQSDLDLRIEEARQAGQDFFALYLDLDGFKGINDVFGHPTGDALLQKAAERLMGLVGSMGEVYRVGGDEFVLLASLSCRRLVEALASEIVSALSKEFAVNEQVVQIGSSVGIAAYSDCNDNAVNILKHADIALYVAKQAGKGCHRYFESRMNEAYQRRQEIEIALRTCVANAELSLVYQPQFNMKTKKIVGYEALLRWNHPTLGSLPPSEFIPIAEGCGAIFDISRWVFNTAYSAAAKWDKNLIISVNLSAVQFEKRNLVEMIQEAIIRNDIPASRLEIELTETALARNPQDALDALRRLKALGVRIALDDFGTGFSSLSYLNMFPFDTLKLDREFIAKLPKNHRTAAIVRSLVDLGHNLNLKVIAEGVETGEQYGQLEDWQCDFVQGFYTGRPQAFVSLENPEQDSFAIGSTKSTALSVVN